jgi:glycosyltransferase involved in cell wall biosynthesis
MRRILLVTGYFWPEDFVINDLAEEFAKYGLKVTVLTQQPSYPKGRIFHGYQNRLITWEKWNGISILRIKTVLGYRESLVFKLLNYAWFAIYGSIIALFTPFKFDAVLVYQVGPLTIAIPGIVAAKAKRRPLVLWTQDLWPDSVFAYGFRKTGALSTILDVFVRWIYASVDSVAISCRGFGEVLGQYTRKDLHYAPNWPMTPYHPGTATANRGSEPVFLFAGNVGKVQNLENVVRAFAKASVVCPTIGRLRIVGDGSALSGLKKLSNDLGVLVDFPGRIPASSISGEYDKADFLVLSLTDEPVFRLTVPAKFQMYLSVGKPILCAAGGEVARMVREGQLGIAADPSDVDAIAAAFLEMRRVDRSRVEHWQANARSVLAGEFDKKTIIDSLLSRIILAKAEK